MKKILTAVALVALLLDCSAGCPAPPANDTSVEVEDCDAEDYANKEADCGFKKTKKPTPAIPTRRTS